MVIGGIYRVINNGGVYYFGVNRGDIGILCAGRDFTFPTFYNPTWLNGGYIKMYQSNVEFAGVIK